MEIGGVVVSNPDKVLYPGNGFTKAQVLDYYVGVAEYLVPHLADRPVTMKRYPDGVAGKFFYEKNAPRFAPDWVRTFPVPRGSGGQINYILINDVRTLAWCANLASLELHPFLHRVPDISVPTAVVFDLDPGEDVDITACAEVARLIKEILDALGLESFPKVSGSRGLQLYVPLNSPASYAVSGTFARTVAELLANQRPDLVVSEMKKSARGGKVFIDWSQNNEHKTTAAVYSLRAKHDSPFVSMPVRWQELKRADPGKLRFDPAAALRRLKRMGDLFHPVLEMRQTFPPQLLEQIQAWNRNHGPAKTSLAEYSRKRDFTKTAEPPPAEDVSAGRRRFVIQKHEATRLHYDFRLEMDGVLKSWALPKGPPYERNEKHLAVATEDHPVEYLEFEGTIPKGQYGGGTVMVWDIGAYEVMDGSYSKGKLHLFLDGRKLRGEWILVKTPRTGEKNWLIIKGGDSMEPPSSRRDDSSALTRRSMKRIASDADARWTSNRIGGVDLRELPEGKARFVEPMMAKSAAELPEGGRWIYEIKLDGFRALALKSEGKLRLLSRRGNDLEPRFPKIARALAGLPDDTVVDGEIVALDEKGRPCFNLIQNSGRNRAPVFFYAFDLPLFNGRDLTGLALEARRRVLEEGALAGLEDPVRLSTSLEARPSDLVAAAREQGLEGVVAKRRDSEYEAGRRSGAWVKVKTHGGQELVIAGYTPGSHGFDALLAGYYDEDKLIYAGKVRNGFVPIVREEVYARFKGLETDACPFSNLPETRRPRFGEALNAEAMKACRWLRPELVARVEFAEWTEAGRLRHPKFLGLTEEKSARQVVRELLA